MVNRTSVWDKKIKKARFGVRIIEIWIIEVRIIEDALHKTYKHVDARCVSFQRKNAKVSGYGIKINLKSI